MSSASSGTDRGRPTEAPRRGKVRRRPRAEGDDRLREILTVCRQLDDRVHRELGEFRQVMTDVRAAQGRIEHRLGVQGVVIDCHRRELDQLAVRQDNADERLGRAEGELVRM